MEILQFLLYKRFNINNDLIKLHHDISEDKFDIKIIYNAIQEIQYK